ncbi:MAG: hypothetical protein WC780_15555 [Lentimicrobiaceae bacterium]|jgi:hypothetical protein
MHDQIMTVYSRQDMKNIFIEGMKEYDSTKATALSAAKTFSINQVAKLTCRSHATISKLVAEGFLKTASDGKRITATSLDEYLKSSSAK